MRSLTLLCFGLVFTLFVKAQSSEMKAKLQQYKAQYPTENFVLDFVEQQVSFQAYKKDQDDTKPELSMIQKNNFVFTALNTNYAFSHSAFFSESYQTVSDGQAYAIIGSETYGSYKDYVLRSVKDYETEGIFHNDLKRYQISFPYNTYGLTKGISYEINNLDPKFYNALYFHDVHPIKKSIIKVTIPYSMDIELLEYNFDKFKVTKSVVDDPKKKVKIITYELGDLKSVNNDLRRTLPMDFTYPYIVPWAKGFSVKMGSNTYFKSVADLYQWLHELNTSCKNNPKEIETLVNTIIGNEKDSLVIAKKLYYWIQDNIRYIAFEHGIHGYMPQNCQSTVEFKYGDCKAVANLLTEMLVLKGFDAHRTWIHTQYSNQDISKPLVSNFNHAICALFINGQTIYLDPTETYSAFGDLAFRISGRPVLIENGDSYKILVTPKADFKTSKSKESQNLKIVGDSLVGTTSTLKSGDVKNDYLRYYHLSKSQDQEKAIIETVKSANPNYVIRDFKHSDVANREIDFRMDYKMSISNRVFRDENLMYVQIAEGFGLFNLEKDTSRKEPIAFYSTVNNSYETRLEIPKGYSVSSMPESVEIKNVEFEVKAVYRKEGNTIVFQFDYYFPQTVITTDNLPAWFAVQKKLKTFLSDQIVLTR